jgi:hypothetical protein
VFADDALQLFRPVFSEVRRDVHGVGWKR